jgi:hypothetical protein
MRYVSEVNKEGGPKIQIKLWGRPERQAREAGKGGREDTQTR